MITSSTSANSIAVTSANVPTSIEIKEAPKKLKNDFIISTDGRQASRKYTISNPTEKELIFTVFFPANATDTDHDKLLENLSEKNLKVLGECAVALGLTLSTSKKSKITSISFIRDDKGLISGFSKKRSTDKDKHEPHVITIKYYQEKLVEKTTPDVAKRNRFQIKMENFQKLQNFWENLNNPQKT